MPRLRNYPLRKRLFDRAYTLATRGHWPARLAWTVRAQADLHLDEQTILVPDALGQARTLRIAFASDFHAGPATAWPLLERCIARLEALAPDVLLLGGDFVSLDARDGERLAEMLGRVPSRLGRYAVLGNHDHWAGARRVEDQLARAGIEMLTNRNVPLPSPFERVSICGLDDHMSGDPDPDATFAGARDIRVVLMHAPSGLLDIGDRNFALAVCGHTHGGQIALPGGRPIVVAHGPLSRQYNGGRYALAGGRTLLVSRGVGCGTLPFRVNAPSSVHLCEVTGAADTPEP